MTVAFDAVQVSTATLASAPYTHSFSFTPGDASAYMMVGVSTVPSTVTINSITWRGLSGLSQLATVANSPVRAGLWALASKPGGTPGTVLVTASGQCRLVVAAITYSGVDLNSPYVTPVTNSGLGIVATSGPIVIPADGLMVDVLGVDGGNATVSAGGSQAQRWNSNAGNLPSQSVRGAGSERSGTGSSSGTWSISATAPSSREWATVAIALNPVEGAGAGPLSLMGAGE